MPGNDDILEKLEVLAQKPKMEELKLSPKKAAQNERERWANMEKTQRWTFEKIIKKRHPQLTDDWKDLFAIYFISLREGTTKSINDFLYKNRLGQWNNDNLKVPYSDD